ncbi:hypothetical protein EDD18DRAFT_1410803 [Armillaria luteobubalina]|uniref:Uncharacterized protein n=1 Tax=Armillaria luteobubalina TaxID=153913 RepID=A0AA39QIK5_9AGAR|nr:hypothetical protein EDD18DRAFT_1410803 [Armillaria luteobubalina]
MLDRDEAERLPVVIPQEDIDNDPEAFAWYEGPQGGGFIVPIQFKKYPNRPVNETPIGYLHYIVNKCSWNAKYVHSLFFDAIDVYFEGLMEYAKDHYAEFVIPFGTMHRGKRLQQCRDKPWMEWTTTRPVLTQKYIVYFTAVQYFLDNPRHYTANRDIGELLSATKYEDDLDLGEEDDEYETDSFINDDDVEEEPEQEQESSETADDSEASSRAEVESTQPSDVEGSQSGISDGIDSDSSMRIPPRMIQNFASKYRLEKRHDGRSPVPIPPAPMPRKRRQGSGASKVGSDSKASPRKRRLSSVDSSDHSEDSDDAEEIKPKQSRRCKRGPRKGKQKAHTSEMEDFISGGEESDGNEDYLGSATEDDNLSDLADGPKQKSCTSSTSHTQCGMTGAQPHQLRSGRKYGLVKSSLSTEIVSEASSPRNRKPPKVIRAAISSAVDSGSDEPNRLTSKAPDPPEGERLPQIRRVDHVIPSQVAICRTQIKQRCRRNEGVQPIGWFQVRRMSFVLLRPKGLLVDVSRSGMDIQDQDS